MACFTPVPSPPKPVAVALRGHRFALAARSAEISPLPRGTSRERGQGVRARASIRDKRPARVALPLGPERRNAPNRLANGLKRAKTG